MNEELIVHEEYHDYTDEDLTKAWNYLETMKFSHYIESKMDYVEHLLKKRGVEAWNHTGEITQRRE